MWHAEITLLNVVDSLGSYKMALVILNDALATETSPDSLEYVENTRRTHAIAKGLHIHYHKKG